MKKQKVKFIKNNLQLQKKVNSEINVAGVNVDLKLDNF